MADKAGTRENLQRLADFVSTKNRSLGFADESDGTPALPGTALSAGINAPDTWTCALADQEADSVREPLNKLAEDFAELHSTLTAEKDSPHLQDD